MPRPCAVSARSAAKRRSASAMSGSSPGLFVMQSTLLADGGHHDLDEDALAGHAGLDGGPRGRVLLVDPALPDLVHLAPFGDVAQPDLRLNDARLVAPRLLQIAVNLLQDLPGL